MTLICMFDGMDGFIFQIMLIVEPNRVNLEIDNRFYNRMIFKYLTEFYTQMGRLDSSGQ